MNFAATLRPVSSQNWAEGLIVPQEMADRLLREIPDKRFVVVISGEHRMQCGLISAGGEYFFYLSKDKRKRWGIELGDTVDLTVSADESVYGIELPEEWAEMMSLDPETDRYFHALTPGNQRNLLHRIGSAKTVETRIRRAVQIAEYLRETGGRLDYKELAIFTKKHHQNGGLNPGLT